MVVLCQLIGVGSAIICMVQELIIVAGQEQRCAESQGRLASLFLCSECKAA